MAARKQSVEVRYKTRSYRVDHDDVIFLVNEDGVDTPAALDDEEKERIIAFAVEKRARGQQ
jgi:hypothetical protein